MGKKRSDRNLSGNVGVLEPCTTRQFVRQGLVAMAKAEFANLGSSDLDEAQELWEVTSALDVLREQYRAGIASKKCQRVVRRIEKFKRQHNL